jgi:hypothetical protein
MPTGACPDLICTCSLFVRLFLGHVNVKVIKSGEKFIMKQEYEKFKGRTNIVMIIGAFLQLFQYPGMLKHTHTHTHTHTYNLVAVRDRESKSIG